MKKWSSWMAFVLTVVSAVAAGGYSLWAHARQRHDLPPFDHEKAKNLSAEKRAEYERLLFNEITEWNTGSLRYRGIDGTNRREADWLAAANDGYELAYITLQVLQPSTGMRFSMDQALKRLSELAEGGDAGAMCLWFPLASYGAGDQNAFDRLYRQKATRHMVAGAAKGHPACLLRTGQRRLRGIDGFEPEPEKGFQELVASELAGYGGAVALHVYFTHFARASASVLERRYCWSKSAAKESLFVDSELDAREIQAAAASTHDPKLEELSEKVGAWNPSVTECIHLALRG